MYRENRSNQEWLSDLRSQGERQNQAISDLRDIILSSLPYALSKWLSPGDPRFSPFTEDVAQESILRVIDKLDTFQNKSKFTTWVYTITVRVALTELRRARWKEISLDDLMMGNTRDKKSHEFSEKNPKLEKNIEQKELIDLLRDVIEKVLSKKQQTALISVAIKGMPIAEVARRMGTNRNAMYKLIHDARVKLKTRLEELDVTQQDYFNSINDGR